MTLKALSHILHRLTQIQLGNPHTVCEMESPRVELYNPTMMDECPYTLGYGGPKISA